MSKGWQTKRLGEVCEIIKGRKPALKATPSAGDLPYLVAKVMRGSKEAEYASVRDRNSIVVENSETIIICDGSNSGEVFTGFRGILSSTMGKVSKKTEIDDDYLRAFLSSTFEVFNGGKTGAAIPHLDKEAMYRLEVPLPPLPEQKPIVAILDEASEGIAIARANAGSNLRNARALFESNLQAVFTQRGEGWVDRRLGDVCQTAAGGTPLKSKREYYEGGTIPWLMSGEVRQGEVVAATKFITKVGLAKSAAKLFPRDTVLVAMYGATAGEVGILRFEAATNQAVCGIFPNERFLPEFVYYLLLSRKQELVDQATGNAQPNISQIKIKNTKVPICSLNEQRRVVARLDSLATECGRLEALYQRKAEELEALEMSLLHHAFTGQL